MKGSAAKLADTGLSWVPGYRIARTPMAWLEHAIELVDSGSQLYVLAQRSPPGPLTSARLRTAIMLFAMSIELSLKSLAAPKLIADADTAARGARGLKDNAAEKAREGILKQLHQHKLDRLAQHTKLRFSNRDGALLAQLSRFIAWEGRYPTPRGYDALPATSQYPTLARQSNSLAMRTIRKVLARPKSELAPPPLPLLAVAMLRQKALAPEQPRRGSAKGGAILPPPSTPVSPRAPRP
jgi:hypothetical protein